MSEPVNLMELEAKANTSWEHCVSGGPAPVVYRCPSTFPPCDKAGWMAGGAIWQHLRGFAHVLNHEEASELIAEAKLRALAPTEEADE